jgi:hypothetical protein
VTELHAIADGMDRPGRPLGETGATVLDALRLIAADVAQLLGQRRTPGPARLIRPRNRA